MKARDAVSKAAASGIRINNNNVVKLTTPTFADFLKSSWGGAERDSLGNLRLRPAKWCRRVRRGCELAAAARRRIRQPLSGKYRCCYVGAAPRPTPTFIQQRRTDRHHPFSTCHITPAAAWPARTNCRLGQVLLCLSRGRVWGRRVLRRVYQKKNQSPNQVNFDVARQDLLAKRAAAQRAASPLASGASTTDVDAITFAAKRSPAISTSNPPRPESNPPANLSSGTEERRCNIGCCGFSRIHAIVRHRYGTDNARDAESAEREGKYTTNSRTLPFMTQDAQLQRAGARVRSPVGLRAGSRNRHGGSVPPIANASSEPLALSRTESQIGVPATFLAAPLTREHQSYPLRQWGPMPEVIALAQQQAILRQADAPTRADCSTASAGIIWPEQLRGSSRSK